MISDVLFDALNDIEEYEKEMQEAYGNLHGELRVVKTVMRAMQRFLDCPPVDSEYRDYHEAVSVLRQAIANLPIDGIDASLNRIITICKAYRDGETH